MTDQQASQHGYTLEISATNWLGEDSSSAADPAPTSTRSSAPSTWKPRLSSTSTAGCGKSISSR